MAVRLPRSAARQFSPKGGKTKPSRPSLPSGSVILCLDVSSTATGLAILRTGPRLPELIGMRLFKPPAAWEVSKRIDKIADDLATYLTVAGYRDPLHQFDLAITERANGSGRGNASRRSGWSHNVVPLANAQGAIREAVRRFVAGDIEQVTSDEWAHSREKATRAAKIRLMYPEYAAEYADEDKGFDVADAIGIGVWRAGL